MQTHILFPRIITLELHCNAVHSLQRNIQSSDRKMNVVTRILQWSESNVSLENYVEETEWSFFTWKFPVWTRKNMILWSSYICLAFSCTRRISTLHCTVQYTLLRTRFPCQHPCIDFAITPTCSLVQCFMLYTLHSL